ncbi:MAG TPA: response regulator transcription factor [Thermoanaerobaculia bacterium]|jgi:DNA-binding NarL/FixJ family response regulator|nr:response regulator transcription factor [Thermoanaerobaculia bacterium]
MSVRILLADDHEILLDGLRALLEKESDFTVIGVARDGREAVEKAHSLMPDVVVMDISMPGLNGIDATRQITAKRPEVKVLCLSAHAEPRFVEAMLEANASGYLLKDYSHESLVQAIRHMIANEVYICPRVGYAVVRALKAERPSATATTEPLTDREREILQLIAEGHSTKEIAGRLFLSIKTVGTHREHLMEKLGIHSVAGLTKYAIREGLTEVTPS